MVAAAEHTRVVILVAQTPDDEPTQRSGTAGDENRALCPIARWDAAHPHAPAICLVVTLRRLKTLVVAIIRISAASARSSKWRAASAQISSGTGSARSLSRVAAYVSASAARSGSVK